ncbi:MULTISPECIES: hypothetical protein [Bacillus cereus group]|uniref:Uncharacterized protein n=1 Tax=Bacillus mycoides TaxID=1405 RepID=A0A1D3MXC0_BACMY|nr:MULTISPECIES: hypothetical protein [Bacillus cereus group]MBJ8190727.1 hypothetical protein [Bacillus cereus]OFD87060.1 hypothetical protein BWGOE11_57570 [Bacillus mycoides]OFD91151.1 hypothetical protein BWGOE13_55610 [Bacillus mycoides]OHX28611.1 hypothetical protein BWGOE5_54880 [Bacillus mycoides]SCM90605.1 A0A073K693 (Uncharacterized protein) [Bacillus mycoides]
MERKITNMMRDLKFLMKHGQVGIDLTDLRYQKLLCSAVEATGRNYSIDVRKQDESTLYLQLR